MITALADNQILAAAAALDACQTYPDHLLFIQNCSRLWSRVRIYDAVPVYDPVSAGE